MFQIAEAHAGLPVANDGADGAVSILQMDPPEHLRHRKLVMSAFRPRYMEQLETRIREITAETLDACDPTGELDFVEQIAVPLPMRVIAEMLGVSPGDAADFRRWSDSIIEAGGGGVTEQTLHDMGELFAYFTVGLDDHRAHPRDDIITLLLDAELDGERLGKGEILMFLMTLLVAGNETTRNLIAGGGRLLADHPDQQAQLATDPSLIPGAVDEMLRFVSPVRSFVRRAQIDTTIGDTAIRAEDYVVLFYGSGNRDEEVVRPHCGPIRRDPGGCLPAHRVRVRRAPLPRRRPGQGRGAGHVRGAAGALAALGARRRRHPPRVVPHERPDPHAGTRRELKRSADRRYTWRDARRWCITQDQVCPTESPRRPSG